MMAVLTRPPLAVLLDFDRVVVDSVRIKDQAFLDLDRTSAYARVRFVTSVARVCLKCD
jgi:hypothetical protein